MSATMITCLKDEGPFLIEWLAYHKSIGFRRFLVGANNCTDGSHEMLSRLAELDEIEYFPFSKVEGVGPQETLAEILLNSCVIDSHEWIIWLDLDEFLNIHVADGTVNDLLAKLKYANGIRINWRIFGANANRPWPGRQLHQALCRCSHEDFGVSGAYPANRTFKSLYRYVDGMRLWAHGPIFSREHIDSKPVWLQGNGRKIRKAKFPYKVQKLVADKPGLSYLPGRPAFDWAQINHYATRHPLLAKLKRQRGRGGTYVPRNSNRSDIEDFTDRHSDAYFERYNRTDNEDTSILEHLPEVDSEMARLLSDDTVQHWHRYAQSRLNKVLQN